MFSHSTHLRGRYPALASDDNFLSWFSANGAQVWHETKASDEGDATVVVQSLDGLHAFAARLHRSLNRDLRTFESTVSDSVAFDLVAQGLGPTGAIAATRRELGAADAKVHSARPMVDFSADRGAVFWVVEIEREGNIETFHVDSSQAVKSVGVRQASTLRSTERPIGAAGPDWLESNECHHLLEWRDTALQIVGPATSTFDRAFEIFASIGQVMTYNGAIFGISEFTWSDNLAIRQNNWSGICDEWAVVQVTMLRALGIPAVIKWLVWLNPGTSKAEAHGVVEWLDDGSPTSPTWRHMDALWGAFDYRARYRNAGMTQVTVMDASYPLDSRYSGDAWGLPDILGDQKFHPYVDFLINPSYPGNARAGYSY
ncbi:transglutaminase-like domain-containing protein [Geodermatophilus sp. URMC 60]